MAAKIKKLRENGSQTIYPMTDAQAVYYKANETLKSTLDLIAGGGRLG